MTLTLEMLGKYMKDCNDKLNKDPSSPPTANEFRSYIKGAGIHVNPYNKHTHNQILRAAYLKPKKTWRLSDTEIEQALTKCKEMLLDLYNKKGETPNQSDFIEYLHENDNTFTWSRYTTYNKMLEELGFPVNRRTYSKEELKEILLKKVENNGGKVPTQLEIEQDKGMPGFATYIRTFEKSYNQILKEFNLTPNYLANEHSPDDLVKYLKDFYAVEKRAPYYEELENPSWSIFKRHFGGLRQAIRKAGIPYNRSAFGSIYESNHGDIRPSLIDGRVDDWIYNNGIIHEHEIPYQDLVEDEGLYVVDYVISGTPYLIEVAGMVTEREFTEGTSIKIKHDYIRKLRKKMDILKDSQYKLIIIFKDDPIQEEKLSALLPFATEKATVQLEGKVITKSQTEKRTAKKYQDDYLIENIITRYYELGEEIPTLDDMRVDGWPNPKGTYQRRGNWSSWKERSGVNDLYRKKIKKEMIEHLLYIEEQVNRRPYCTDLEKYLKSDFNRDKYRTEFGSWTKALEEYYIYKKEGSIRIGETKTTRKPYTNYVEHEIKTIAIHNKEHFSTRKKWDEFASQNNFPSSVTYARHFGGGSWNLAKVKLGFDEINRRKYKTEELIEIGIEYDLEDKSVSEWTKIAQEKDLPSVSSFERKFGNWGNAKKKVKENKEDFLQEFSYKLKSE